MTSESLVERVEEIDRLWGELHNELDGLTLRSQAADNLLRAIDALHQIRNALFLVAGDESRISNLVTNYFTDSAKVVTGPATEFWIRYSDTNDRGIRSVLGKISGLEKQLDENIRARSGAFDLRPIDPRPNIDAVADRVGDISGYPLLISDLHTSAPASSSGMTGGSTQSLIDAAMRKALGRLPRNIDPKTFLSALEQSFEIKEIEGRTEVTWRDRVYAGRAELGGGVTGAQARLYSRAQDAYDKFAPLIRDFHPLLTKADQEDVDAARAILTQQFSAIVEELGTEGGPRPAKVDEAFETLKATFKRLEKIAGMKPGNVNTIEEDAALSDFRLAGDYLYSTRAAWNGYKTQPSQDLGANLFRLSNTFQVITESVDEVEASLDSVFIGSAERTVAMFVVRKHPEEKMRVSELLSWIHTFASDEAPRLVRDGGRVGAGALLGTLDRLIRLTAILRQAVKNPRSAGLPEGMGHPRVGRALSEVVQYLEDAQALAEKIAPADPDARARAAL